MKKPDPQEERERAYLQGQRAVWKSLLDQAVGELIGPGGMVNYLEPVAYIQELESARAELVMLCEQMGIADPYVEDESMHAADAIKQVTQALVDERRRKELREVGRLRALRNAMYRLQVAGEPIGMLWPYVDALVDDVDLDKASVDEQQFREAGQRLHDSAEQFREMVRRARGLGDETTAVLTARLVLEAAVRNWESLSSAPGTSQSQDAGEGSGALTSPDEKARSSGPEATAERSASAPSDEADRDLGMKPEQTSEGQAGQRRVDVAQQETPGAGERLFPSATPGAAYEMYPLPKPEPLESLDQEKLVPLCRTLIGLLDAPEPGYATWHIMCADVAKKMRECWSVKNG